MWLRDSQWRTSEVLFLGLSPGVQNLLILHPKPGPTGVLREDFGLRKAKVLFKKHLEVF